MKQKHRNRSSSLWPEHSRNHSKFKITCNAFFVHVDSTEKISTMSLNKRYNRWKNNMSIMLPSIVFFTLKNQAEKTEAPLDQMQPMAWVPVPLPLQPSQAEDLAWHIQTTRCFTEEVHSSVCFHYQGITVSSFTYFPPKLFYSSIFLLLF